MFVPPTATAHQRLAYASRTAPFPKASPLWLATVARACFAKEGEASGTAFHASGLEQELSARLAKAFPDHVFSWSGFSGTALYPTLSWRDGPSEVAIHEIFGLLGEQWGRRLYVAPAGSVHPRPARHRLPSIFNHRIQFNRRYSDGAHHRAMLLHATLPDGPNRPALHAFKSGLSFGPDAASETW